MDLGFLMKYSYFVEVVILYNKIVMKGKVSISEEL